jgi:hypothetical protein
MPKQRIVYITKEGSELFEEQFVRWFLHDGSYFVCENLHQDSALLVLENVQIVSPAEINFQLDLQIPFAIVRYIVSGAYKKVLGFVESRPIANKKLRSRS